MLTKYPKITTLNISCNRLTSISEVNSFPNLKHLDISFNSIYSLDNSQVNKIHYHILPLDKILLVGYTLGKTENYHCSRGVMSLPLTQRAWVQVPIGSVSWLRFFPGFSLNCKKNVRKFRPHLSQDIIWPS